MSQNLFEFFTLFSEQVEAWSPISQILSYGKTIELVHCLLSIPSNRIHTYKTVNLTPTVPNKDDSMRLTVQTVKRLQIYGCLQHAHLGIHRSSEDAGTISGSEIYRVQ